MIFIFQVLKINIILILIIITIFILYRYIFLAFSFKKEKNICIKENTGKKYFKFIFLIPANNEELLIEKTISSLKRIDYPPNLMEILVVADNCTDNTASIVRKNGVKCLERFDNVERGKGYALDWVLRHVDLDHFDAVVILDADTLVNSKFLKELNLDLLQGKKIIQGYHGVIHNKDYWILNLAHLSDILQFYIHFTGKARLGLSVRLLGTGMCFSTDILKTYGWRNFSLTEDFEQYLKFVSHGEVIHFNPRVFVRSYQPWDLKNANVQRHRWIRGEMELAIRYFPKLFKDGVLNRNWKKLDAVFESIMPSFSSHFFLMSLAFIGGLVLQDMDLLFWWISIASLTMLYIAIGLKKGNIKIYLYLKPLLLSPIYILWKILIILLSLFKVNKIWVRTPRK